MGSKFIIYGLIDPLTRQVRYIGKSSSGTERAMAHGQDSRSEPNLHKARWIGSLKDQGLAYDVVILEQLESQADLNGAECDWIASAKRLGWPLTNLTDGGDGGPGCIPGDETRARMSEAQRNRVRSKEEIEAFLARNRAAIAEGRRKKPDLTPELRAAYSAAAKKANESRWAKPGAREEMSASLIGNQRGVGHEVSAETRAKMSAAKLGTHHSEETKAKITAALAARWATEERAPQPPNKGRTGHTNSPEHRARIAEGQRQRHARAKLERERLAAEASLLEPRREVLGDTPAAATVASPAAGDVER